MKRNMQLWFEELLKTSNKKPLPLLSFPAVQPMGITVRELISDSDLQAKAMKTVADRTDALASVSLMDLSVEAECFGSKIHFEDNEVPNVVNSIVSSLSDAENLDVPAIGSGRTGVCIEAIKRAAEQIEDRPIFAGIIGPFSLAGRLMDISEVMIYCYDDPDMVHTILDKVTSFLVEYCKAFFNAGANGVVMAEPLAGILSPSLAEEFSEPYVRRIVEAVQNPEFAVIYHNCGDNTPLMLDSIYRTGCVAYHFGNAVNMEDILKASPADKIIMGNIDPAGILKNGTPELVHDAVCQLLKDCNQYPNFIISSGCDIPPLTPWDNIDAFFNSIREFYA